MIELFHGDDLFESEKAVKARGKKLAAEKGIDLEILNADEINDPTVIANSLESYGMFSDAKVIIAKRLLNNKNLVNFFLENFDFYSKFDFLIWHDSSADKRLKFYKLIKSKGIISEHVLPKVWELENWFLALAKSKKINLTKEHVHYIVERVGLDKTQLIITLHKIFLLNHEKISLDDIKKIIGFDVRGDIWEFLDAFGNRKIKDAEGHLAKLLQYDENVQYILAMLARELDLLAQILLAKKNGTDLKSLGIHPFVLKKSIEKANNFSLEDILYLTTELMNFDGLIKSGRISQEIGLKLYVSKVLRDLEK